MTDFRLCVAHLVWGPLGLGPLKTFVESYAEHDAAYPHELVVIYNNVDERLRYNAEQLLSSTAHKALALPERMLDIAVTK